MNETLLSARGIVKRFAGFCALDGVDLDVTQGAIHGLIGPNGAGKSTFINVLAGQLRPSEGQIRLRGDSLVGLAPHEVVRRGVARSFQITSIFPGYTVYQNVQIALMAHAGHCGHWLRPAAPTLREETERLLETSNLLPDRARVAGELAAGDRKRLEFAISLASQPALLLLDEPTAGMSPSERAMVTETILRLNRELGMTVLFTEHDIEMVFGTAQRVTVLHQGRKLAEGAPRAVRSDARVQEVYLGGEAHAELP
ncbi:ABC transporter ATP-binding protein [Variovorax defluvii]|uniref:ABC transporter ATP-binding protein n=1 Tax=Variovorax defluvii TaxID=913761 RepID=A0ABP8HFW3_9BURK